ncbi:MAG: SDR family oxidoreductase [Ignavibacteriae bacterium]|nr:MAG: SDR family oxidoreductase [Ignavibacteriota bacterium]
MTKRVCWVTGASTGIGFETAKVFAKAGYIVYATARRKSRLVKLVNELKFAGHEAYAIVCNIQSERSVFSTKKRIIEKSGAIDILVNNAGVTIFKSLLDTKSPEFDNIMDTNLRGSYLAIKSVLPGMVKRKKGHIINVLSTAANSVFEESAVYSGSKAGLLAMSNVLRAEVRKYNIKVTNILPGNVDTPMWDAKIRNRYKNRMMSAREIADIILETAEQPKRVVMEDVVIRPIKGDL